MMHCSDIFDMFNQAERDGNNLQGGLGIGLNLVKRSLKCMVAR